MLGCLAFHVITSISIIDSFIAAGVGPQLRIALDNYYICEEKGHNPDMCDQFEIPENKHTVSEAIFYVIFGLFQVTAIVFVLDIQQYKKAMHTLYSTIKQCSQSS